MNMGQFRKMVRSAMASPHVSRVRIFNFGLTQNTTIYTPKLLACDDDPDYDLTTDGTNVSECQPFSRITKIDLKCRIQPGGTNSSNRIEWILLKDPDGALEAGAITPASLFLSDVSLPSNSLRKYTLAYGWTVATTNKDGEQFHIRIRRKALLRAGLMHDGDKLLFVFTNNHATLAGTLDCTGRIVTTGR